MMEMYHLHLLFVSPLLEELLFSVERNTQKELVDSWLTERESLCVQFI